MGVLGTVLVILGCLVPASNAALTEPIYVNVLNYGAVGNGYIDDSHALLMAWHDACNFDFEAQVVNMIIPGGRTYLVKPTVFYGPCKPANVNVKIYGTIIAPETMETWDGIDATQWLAFKNANGLTVTGTGIIDGQGSNWWAQSCRHNHAKGCTSRAPTAIKFISCQNCGLRNLQFINSANTHILIQDCNMFRVSNLYINSPKTSPNTDGIHIDNSEGVFIDSSIIKSGDDCISIGDHTSNIIIQNINCGPGHGISVGSLGKGGSYVQVENIHVSNVNFSETQNGVRIKTWQGATGYARDISFKEINFDNVKNPIIIDQYYCNHLQPDSCRPKDKKAKGVHISDVMYKRAFGTSSTEAAIQLHCSQSVACTGIVLDTIRLYGAESHDHHHGHHGEPDEQHHERVISSCINAHGRTEGVIQPATPCLIQE